MALTTAARGRGIGHQIPRNTLALLMLAQVVVILPYLSQLSPWIIGVALFCGGWRAGVYQARWNYPPRSVKALLVGAAVLGIAVSDVTALSLEAAASLLIVAYSLKLVEMKGRRDAYVVIFLGYFIVATQFLFDQSFLLAGYQLGALVVVTAAMVGLNQQSTRVRPLRNLSLAAGLIAQALPLTLVAFLFFPRIAPLWTVPVPSASTTGISDRMTPGDVAQLARSDELAFRVEFAGTPPPSRELYWRGLVYSEFDQGTWSVGAPLPAWGDSPPVEPAGDDGIDYEVLLEPTQSDWLYALETPFPRSASTVLTRDHRLQARDPVLSVFRYRVRSHSGVARDAELPDWLRRRETRLPVGDNPRLRAYAADLRAQHDDRAFVEAVLAHIRAEPYFYTLSPPQLPRVNSIDAFWFDSQRGFCSHYAGALVFMLRSVGIPARLIGGYQGGEISPVTGHLVVRQYEAHAWVELWLPGQGWTRVDPTAAVAPARIEQGLSAALSREDRDNLTALASARLGGSGVLRELLYWGDSLEHRWNLWVVGYDTQLQGVFLADLLGEITPARVGLAVLAGGGVSLGLIAASLFWRRRAPKRRPAERLFERFCAQLARSGWARRAEEAPGAFLQRLGEQGAISPAQAVALVAEVNALLYNPDLDRDRRALRRLRAQFRRVRFRLLLGPIR